MEDFSLLYWVAGKYAESEKDTQPLSSASAKKVLEELKNVQLLDVVTYSMIVKVQQLAYTF